MRVLTIAVAACVLLSVGGSPTSGSAYPGRNGRIAFGADRDGDDAFDPDLYTMRSDGTGVKRLTSNEGIFDACPIWSPDGERLLYCSTEDGDFDVWMMNRDGSDRHVVQDTDCEPDSGACDEFFGNWSPDMERYTYPSSVSGNMEIYVADIDGTDPVQLTDDPAWEDLDPVWSADGRWIAWEKLRETETTFEADIWIMRSDGSDQRRLTPTDAPENEPDFSPNSRRMVFGYDGTGNGDIYTMRIDGSDLRRITRGPAPDYIASYSPNGRWIVFASERGQEEEGARDLFKIRTDGTGLRRLSRDPHPELAPNWQPRPPRVCSGRHGC